ncbi:Amp-binding domain [Mycena chlorophos]|uniref:Amp-binding domain n=1 Tax=Mycena chlorophos TaxID=658473 RepID=A0A8H6WAE0_MYCCL|nr:Amp-binding domain [Mycena chlorophos]
MFKATPASIPPPNARLALPDPKGPDARPWLHPLNPLQFILRAAEIYPNKIALVDDKVVYDFKTWCQRTQNLAYALTQAGIKPGDRVAVIAPNCPMAADTFYGVLAVQGILCLINTRLKPSDVAYILDHSGAKIILIDHEFTHLVPNNTNVPVVICKDSGKQGDPYEDFLTAGRRFSQERGWSGLVPSADENASAILCYTSGTTGRPKGVVTTLRGSYLAAVANAYESKIHSNSTYLWILPMFHAAGWTFPWSCVFAMGKQITMRTVDYPTIWRHFLHSSVTHYCGAPTVQIGIVNDPAARKLKHSVSAIIAGAAPTASLIGSLEGIGIKPIHVYGLTETYGPFTRNYEQDAWTKMSIHERSQLMARQGHAFATAQNVRVVKVEGSELTDVPRDGKTIGEIVTRGNIVMKEYFRDPEATTKAFRGGSFNSGDLAVMFEDGTVSIVDRQKDIIISGGENISSLSVEQELSSHPDVLEATVVARAHPKWGERPHAFIILKPHISKWHGKHDEFAHALKAHAKKRLPGFAVPEWIQVVSELPKTATGKILKTDLRNMVAKL